MSTNLVVVLPSFVVSFVAEQLIAVHLFQQVPYAVGLVHQHRELDLVVQLVHWTNWLAFLYQQHDRFLDLGLNRELELLEVLLLVVEV